MNPGSYYLEAAANVAFVVIKQIISLLLLNNFYMGVYRLFLLDAFADSVYFLKDYRIRQGHYIAGWLDAFWAHHALTVE